MKICTSITGWGNPTIRDMIQFATFSTKVRHVLCDLFENATQFKNCNDFVLRSMTKEITVRQKDDQRAGQRSLPRVRND